MKRILYFSISLCLIIYFAFLGGAGMVNAKANQEIKFEGKSAILIDASSGMVLFSQNEDARYPIASMNKIMTLLLTFEAIDAGQLNINQEVVVSENASGMGGSQVFLDANANYKVSDLIKSIVVSSANDASVALAETISGSEEAFVAKMNERAKTLDLKNTHFVNATGLPAPESYSSAKDVSTMFNALIKHKNYFAYSKIFLDTLTHPSGRETQLANTNKLIRFYNGCDAGKTGSTSEAKFCLCATAKRGDMRLIACVIGCDNAKIRNAQVSNMFNYGFANYKNISLVSTSEVFEVPISKGNSEIISGSPISDFNIVTNIQSKLEIEKQEVLFDNLSAPLSKGDKIGEIIITQEGKIIKKIDIVSNVEAKSKTYKNSVIDVLKNWAI